eukprot:461488-Hanusia_phi.AAC.1
MIDSLQRRRICIPQAARKKVLYRAHDLASHRGFSRTYLALVAIVYWPGMRTKIEKYILSCQSCLGSKSYRKKQMGIAHSHLTPSERFATISIDMISGFPKTRTGFDAIFVIVEHFTGR